MLLRSLSGKYPWERYEPSYPPGYGLNSTTTVLLGKWLRHWIIYKGWYAIKEETKPIQKIHYLGAGAKSSNVVIGEAVDYVRLLAEALQQVSHVVMVVVEDGADGKVVIERLYLSLPYVEKPFNSKVIKSFVPELRNRQVFFVFRDSYVIYVRYGHYERFG